MRRQVVRRAPTLSFGTRNKLTPTLKPNINYISRYLASVPTKEEVDIIRDTIISSFDESSIFRVIVTPGGFGEVAIALADSPSISDVYIVGGNEEMITIAKNNIQAYKVEDKITFVSSIDEVEEASVLYLDTIWDPNISIADTIKEYNIPLYIARTPPNHEDITLCQRDNYAKMALFWCQKEEEQQEVVDEEDVYIDGLLAYLDKLLANIIPDEKRRSKFFTEDTRYHWRDAFTSETVDINHNYELEEMLGDRVMKLVFADYLRRTRKGINESGLTELQNYYLTTIPQSQKAKEIGLDKWVRVLHGEPGPKVLEDVLESFFGTLFTLSFDVDGGMGYQNAYAMLRYLYQNEDIDAQYELVKNGAPKTQITKIFQMIGVPPPIFKFEDNRGVLVIVEAARREFRTYGVDLPLLLWSGTGNTKTSTSKQAYQETLNLLNSKGVTVEWAKINKRARLFSSITGGKQALDKAKRDGYITLDFQTPHSTHSSSECTTQLIGINEAGRVSVLAEAATRDCKSGKQVVINNYLGV